MNILVAVIVLLLAGDSNASEINQRAQLENGEFAAKCTVKVRHDKKIRTYSLTTERTSLLYIDKQCNEAAKRYKGDGVLALVKWEMI